MLRRECKDLALISIAAGKIITRMSEHRHLTAAHKL